MVLLPLTLPQADSGLRAHSMSCSSLLLGSARIINVKMEKLPPVPWDKSLEIINIWSRLAIRLLGCVSAVPMFCITASLSGSGATSRAAIPGQIVV